MNTRPLRPSLLIAMTCSLSLAAVGCAPPARSPLAPRELKTSTIEGTWYCVASNLPMWTSGERTSPVFSYRALELAGSTPHLDDSVTFMKDGEKDSFDGTDTRDPNDAAHFTWHGKGSLSFVSSDWYVSRISADRTWAIISYDATIATPAGIDIVSRTPSLEPAKLTEAMAFIAADPTLRSVGGPLAEVDQRDASRPVVGSIEAHGDLRAE